jgi:hypothetical protein
MMSRVDGAVCRGLVLGRREFGVERCFAFGAVAGDEEGTCVRGRCTA